MYTVFSSSLNSDSCSRLLARAAVEIFTQSGCEAQLIDLAEIQLPFCDAGDCYSHDSAVQCREAIEQSDGILIAAPVYNYDLSAAAKNLIELTGRAWTNKVVGFMAAAGGSGSYMSVMGLANSLMLDFRATIVPRFVYATGECFVNGVIKNDDVRTRVEQLVLETVRYSRALNTPE
ncbi:MAG: NAD(P)H-dependent oxidoreductase [Pirellulaceae bacterium]